MLVEELKGVLENIGYYHTQVKDIASFKALCAQLGQVRQFTEVKLDPSKDQFPYISGAVDFHTDNPTVDIIGWFAIEQDREDGAIFVMDSQLILEQMSLEEQALLNGVQLKMPSRQDEYHPILTNGSKPHLFYIPPHCWKEKPRFQSDAEEAAVLRFHELVLQARKVKAFRRIGLQRGEVLFINNRFMIHGRDPLAPNSQRFLLRAFIRSQDVLSPQGFRRASKAAR